MPPDDETIAALGDDPQIHSRLAATLTPRHVTRTASEAIALQLASTGPAPEGNAQVSGIHVGYTAVAPLTTASLFRYVRDQCGDAVAALGCEAATRAHLVGTRDPPQQGPLIREEIRLTICDAIATADADLRATIVRAVMSNEVAFETAPEYTTQSLASVVAVGQTLAAADQDPFDARIAACLDCIVPLQLTGEHEASTPDVAPISSAMLGPYLEAVWSMEPTVTSAARATWKHYKTDHASDAWSAWTNMGSTSQAETVPKLAAALARLHLSETVTVNHTTTAIEWFETVTARPAVIGQQSDDPSSTGQ
ncbi:hypothetical protein [Halorubrum halophilum]|uniref:hypothetical protein n=1 Tax=Halorubrum halophilum TaxID=413816 RepID=UPI0006789098|nr:hypothetical protein [Halorubrum halophilum]